MVQWKLVYLIFLTTNGDLGLSSSYFTDEETHREMAHLPGITQQTWVGLEQIPSFFFFFPPHQAAFLHLY